ncbi:hypothetical protein, partial [Komagataeibacter xylinus]|uniref:hypothetical protein n=1 Tax=Komagataeibacter xylinus TaxID=28448 RepID=UPI0022323615
MMKKTPLSRMPPWVPVVVGASIMGFAGSITLSLYSQGLLCFGTVTLLVTGRLRPPLIMRPV